MATIKLNSNGNVITKNGNVSCDCCEAFCYTGFQDPSTKFKYLALADWDCCYIDESKTVQTDSFTIGGNTYSNNQKSDGHMILQCISSTEVKVVSASGNYCEYLNQTYPNSQFIGLFTRIISNTRSDYYNDEPWCCNPNGSRLFIILGNSYQDNSSCI